MSPPPSDHGDIATMRFEEYIVEFSLAFLFISVTGYERFEESPSTGYSGYRDRDC